MAQRFKVIGVNDEQDYCDICGKQELTKVVWFLDTENGDTFAAGVVCAAKKQGITVHMQKKAVEEFQHSQFLAARAETKELRKAYNLMLDNAPHGNLRERLDFVHSSVERKAFYSACEVAAAKYGVKDVNRLHH